MVVVKIADAQKVGKACGFVSFLPVAARALAAARSAVDEWGLGGSAGPVLSDGNTSLHRELEERLSDAGTTVAVLSDE